MRYDYRFITVLNGRGNLAFYFKQNLLTMLFREFAPLKPEFETVVISPSTLEHELVPSPDFMKQQDIKKKAVTFWIGNIVEDIAWITVSQWKEKWYEKCRVWRQYMEKNRMEFYSPSWVIDKQYLWLYDWLEQIVDLALPYYAWDAYNLRNHNWLVEIHASWYRVLLKWECDWWMDWQALFDNKTAKQRRKEDEMRDTRCYQARFYSRIQFLSHPEINEISFTYLIFQKNKKILLQDMTKYVTRKECEDFVWEKLKEYLTKVKAGEIKTSEEALDRL